MRPSALDLSQCRARRHARVDEMAGDMIIEIRAMAKAARADVNRRAGQRLRRIEENMRRPA